MPRSFRSFLISPLCGLLIIFSTGVLAEENKGDEFEQAKVIEKPVASSSISQDPSFTYDEYSITFPINVEPIPQSALQDYLLLTIKQEQQTSPGSDSEVRGWKIF